VNSVSDPLIGQTVSGYVIVRQLGQGGMGAVYLAENREIEQRVAVKVLRPEYAWDPDVTRRFRNEALAANRIQHPGIIKVHTAGHLPDGTVYIVMDFLSGDSLRKRLKSVAPLPQEQGLRFGRQLASALAAAHALDIVHRDLKPENAMIVADPDVPGGERLKILDFGIAKLTAPSASQAHPTEPDAGPMGTPLYIAPEQIRSVASVTAKADVYSLGVMLYEMLAGGPPFRAETAMALMYQHLNATPEPLNKRCPQLPAGIVELVHRMLAKDPSLRPSMSEVAVGLGEKVTRRRSVGLARGAALVGTAVGLSILIAGALLRPAARPGRSNPVTAPLPKVEAPAGADSKATPSSLPKPAEPTPRPPVSAEPVAGSVSKPRTAGPPPAQKSTKPRTVAGSGTASQSVRGNAKATTPSQLPESASRPPPKLALPPVLEPKREGSNSPPTEKKNGVVPPID